MEIQKTKTCCVYLLKKAKKDYYENIDISNLTDSNKFWKTVKPIFGSKIKPKNSITLVPCLVEDTKVIQEGELGKHSTSFLSVLRKILELMKIFSLQTRNVESIIAILKTTLVLRPYVIALIRIVYSSLKRL